MWLLTFTAKVGMWLLTFTAKVGMWPLAAEMGM